MRDLGTVGHDLGGDMPNESQAVAINGRGQIIGNSSVNQNAPVSYAFLAQNGQMTSFSGGGWSTVAEAISDGGNVVGWEEGDVVGDEGFSGVGYGTGQAFAFRDRAMSNLGALPGRPYSWAKSVNEHGQIVGSSYAIDDKQDGLQVRTRATLWENHKPIDLGALPGDTQSEAVAINESGQIIGVSYDKQLNGRGFVWQNGRMTGLGNLTPVAINDRGQVIANRGESSGHGRAFLWQNAKITGLGTLGGQSTHAAAINEQGQIVGTSGGRPFLWQTGRITALPGLGGQDGSAVAINNHGQIVGASNTHAVLWKTTPTR
jgi:probable HAF family extracellular repeat protein